MAAGTQPTRGLAPSEAAFLCEMELVTVVPRQKLDGLDLLGGPTPTLIPPHRATLPLWLALLLRRQNRAYIVPPSWMEIDALEAILDVESDGVSLAKPANYTSEQQSQAGTASQFDASIAGATAGLSILGESAREGAGVPTTFSKPPRLHSLPQTLTRNHEVFLERANPSVLSPPFLVSSTATSADSTAGSKAVARLPYHWLELATQLLSHAAEDFPDPDAVRRLIRDLREVRQAKLRRGLTLLDSAIEGGAQMNGVGAMELAEIRGVISGMVEGMNKVKSRVPEGMGEDIESSRYGESQANGPSGYGVIRQRKEEDDDDDLL